MTDPTLVARIFRAVAIAEACSWVALLAGMFLKWVLAVTEIGVQVAGPVHGALFVAYLLVTVPAARTFRWDARTVVIGVAASVPPLATVWFERHARRTGRLERAGRAAARPA